MDIFYSVFGMNDGDFPNTTDCCYLHTIFMNFKYLGNVIHKEGRIRECLKTEYKFTVCPCNMIDVFIITNTMHTIGVDKITLFKTT